MNKNFRYLFLMAIITLTPQALSNINLIDSTVSSGGGSISNERFTLQSVIGEHDSHSKSQSLTIEHTGGYLPKNTDLIFKSKFEHTNSPLNI